MARASRTKAVGGTAPEQRRSELQRYGDRALKVAEYTAAATTGVIVVATSWGLSWDDNRDKEPEGGCCRGRKGSQLHNQALQDYRRKRRRGFRDVYQRGG